MAPSKTLKILKRYFVMPFGRPKPSSNLTALAKFCFRIAFI